MHFDIFEIQNRLIYHFYIIIANLKDPWAFIKMALSFIHRSGTTKDRSISSFLLICLTYFHRHMRTLKSFSLSYIMNEKSYPKQYIGFHQWFKIFCKLLLARHQGKSLIPFIFNINVLLWMTYKATFLNCSYFFHVDDINQALK